MEENEIDILAAEGMTGFEGLGHGIDEPEIDDFHPVAGEFGMDGGEVTFEPFLESGELWPVGVQADAKESDAGGGCHGESEFQVLNEPSGWRRCPTL